MRELKEDMDSRQQYQYHYLCLNHQTCSAMSDVMVLVCNEYIAARWLLNVTAAQSFW
jgi:hypothetical protein